MAGNYIGGGGNNTIINVAGYSGILAGTSNIVYGSANSSALVGGTNNSVNSTNSVVVGGTTLTLSGAADSFMAGGIGNLMSNGTANVMLGGIGNSISSTLPSSFVANISSNIIQIPGITNLANSLEGTGFITLYQNLLPNTTNTDSLGSVAQQYANIYSLTHTGVSAFFTNASITTVNARNIFSTNSSFVSMTISGSQIVAQTNQAVIIGGSNNTFTGTPQNSFIIGGTGNTLSGNNSFIASGVGNVINSNNSFVSGVSSQALHDNSFVFNGISGTILPTNASSQFLIQSEFISMNSVSTLAIIGTPVRFPNVNYAKYTTGGVANTLSNNNSTNILCKTKVYDTNAFGSTSNGYFTAPRNAVWIIGYVIDFAANSSGFRVGWLSTASNGTGTRYGTIDLSANSTGTEGTIITATSIINVTLGTSVYLFGFQSSGGNLNTGGNLVESEMWLQEIAL